MCGWAGVCVCVCVWESLSWTHFTKTLSPGSLTPSTDRQLSIPLSLLLSKLPLLVRVQKSLSHYSHSVVVILVLCSSTKIKWNRVWSFATDLRLFFQEFCLCCTEGLWINTYTRGTHLMYLQVLYVRRLLLFGHGSLHRWAAVLKNIATFLIITGQHDWKTNIITSIRTNLKDGPISDT